MTAIIILAAGSSSRMGQAKQQLVYRGDTLLQHTIKAAMQSAASQVIMVLGAHAEQVQASINTKQVQQVINENWQLGMASSIQAGIRALQADEHVFDQVLLMLCDQPFVSATLLNRMMAAAINETSIVACAYQDTLGAPVLFGKTYLNDLLALQGQEGAKKLLTRYPDRITAIAFPEGGIDIDTPDDYRKLQDML